MLITPLPGANRDNLLAALRKVHQDITNLYSGGPHRAPERLLAYLEWANDATGHLTGQISGRDIDQLVLTRRHEQILASLGILAATDTARLANGLLNLELRERVKDFEAAVEALRKAITDRPSATQHLVFDTTMYIKHPDKLEQIDFGKLAGVHDASSINLIVPMVVIDELDKLKESRDKHVRWRSGYTLAVIDRLFASPRQFAILHDVDHHPEEPGALPSPEVAMEILFDPPGHARLPIEDDEIVDRAVATSPLLDGPLRLFTYDTGQATRGRIAGLQVEKLTAPREPEPAS